MDCYEIVRKRCYDFEKYKRRNDEMKKCIVMVPASSSSKHFIPASHERS